MVYARVFHLPANVVITGAILGPGGDGIVLASAGSEKQQPSRSQRIEIACWDYLKCRN
jgi:hypothetical protein